MMCYGLGAALAVAIVAAADYVVVLAGAAPVGAAGADPFDVVDV